MTKSKAYGQEERAEFLLLLSWMLLKYPEKIRKELRQQLIKDFEEGNI